MLECIFFDIFSHTEKNVLLEMVASLIHFHSISLNWFSIIQFNFNTHNWVCLHWNPFCEIMRRYEFRLRLWQEEATISDFYTHIFSTLFICYFPCVSENDLCAWFMFWQKFSHFCHFCSFCQTKWKNMD